MRANKFTNKSAATVWDFAADADDIDYEKYDPGSECLVDSHPVP